MQKFQRRNWGSEESGAFQEVLLTLTGLRNNVSSVQFSSRVHLARPQPPGTSRMLIWMGVFCRCGGIHNHLTLRK